MPKNFNLISLPVEILVFIFNHFHSKDLKNLSQTCKTFNSIINSSKNLISKFKLNLSSQKSLKSWIGLRKYQKVNWNANQFYSNEIFEFLGDSLTTLNVIFLKDLKIFIQVLEKCKNLTKISVDFSEVFSNLPEKFSFKTSKVFDELKIEEGIFYIKIFQNVQVKKLKIKQTSPTVKILQLKKFLKTQKILTELELKMSVENFENLFIDNFEVKFKLKKFSLIYLNNQNFNSQIYHENFMKFHQNSLESLENFDAQLFNGLKKFKNLKKLKVMVNSVEDLIKLDQVENLKINLKISGNWSENFKNVKKLKILARGFNFKEAEKLKKLEKISVTFHHGWNHFGNNFYNMLNLSKIKTVKIVNFKSKFAPFSKIVNLSFGNFEIIEWLNVKSPFENENFNVENLILKNCHQFGWLGKYLRKSDANLKNLKIKGVEKMPKKYKKIINKNLKKIENFEMLRENENLPSKNLCFSIFG